MDRILFGCTALAALGTSLAAPAFAQTAAPEERGTIDEIVVTAQRFSETAQRTPLIITALANETLRGVSDVRQLQTLVPGVQLSSAAGVTQTFIRGVGSLNGVSTQEGAVAYNADGVFLFTTSMISPLMYDLERVEILKGPQGTLYGRNASGGAVNLITRGAALGKTSGYVEGEIGNYALRRVVGAVNLPLSDTFAVRLAGQHAEHDGYLSDGLDDQDVTSGRLRALWQPTSGIALKVGFDVSNTNALGAGSTINPNPTSDDFLGGLDPRADTGPFFLGGTSLLSQPPNPAPHFDNDQWSVYADLSVDLGFATLTVLPAYRDEKVDSRNYIPGYEVSDRTHSKQKSLEVRLANQNDRLKWVAGGYYFKIDQHMVNRVRNETNFQDAAVAVDQMVESYAFFGEATFSLTDTFRLIGGLRYTHEESTSNGIANAYLGPPGTLKPITGALNVQTEAFNPFNALTNPDGELLDYYVDARASANATTWKVGAEWDVTDTSMLFATASRGFKGGGNYIDVPLFDSSFRPEYLTAFELGSRNRFFGNRLQLNGEIFYWKLRDQQITYVGFNPIGQVSFLTANAGRAHMYGASIDAIWRPTANDTLHAGVEYLKSKYDSFVRSMPSLAVLPSSGCDITGYAGPQSQAPVTLDCSGNRLLRAPEWSGSADYQRRFGLSRGEMVFNGGLTFASSRYLDPSYSQFMRQKANALFNASLAYNAPEDAFSVTGWVRNITDKRVMAGGNQLVESYARPTLLPPRTFGVTTRISF